MTYLISEPNRIQKRKNLTLTHNLKKKYSQKLATEGNVLNLIKGIYEKPTVNIFLVENECFPCKTENKAKMCSLTSPVQHMCVAPGGSISKETACNAGDPSSIPGLGRSPGEGNGNPLQDSCLKNPMDRGAWRATVQEVTKSWTQLSD